MFNGIVADGTVTQCVIGQFDCGASSHTQRCVQYSWVCDAEEDCDNGADEAMCGMYHGPITSHPLNLAPSSL